MHKPAEKWINAISARPPRVIEFFVLICTAVCQAQSGIPSGYIQAGQVPAQVVTPCSIVKPKDNASFPLSANNTTETAPISFQAISGGTSKITWNAQVTYQTSGGKGTSGATKNFSSTSNVPVSEQFQSVGGQVDATAMCRLRTDAVTFTITGAAVSKSAIIDLLESLYGPGQPTPGLMTGIAFVESTRLQFSSKTLFGISALWPRESPDGGSHIGLMMVPTTMTDAFDWTANSKDGLAVFFEKWGLAMHLERKIQQSHVGLPPLAPFQLENMAIELYGDSPGALLSQ